MPNARRQHAIWVHVIKRTTIREDVARPRLPCQAHSTSSCGHDDDDVARVVNVATGLWLLWPLGTVADRTHHLGHAMRPPPPPPSEQHLARSADKWQRSDVLWFPLVECYQARSARQCQARLERVSVWQVHPKLVEVVVQVAVLVHATVHEPHSVRDLVGCDGEPDTDVEAFHHGRRHDVREVINVHKIRADCHDTCVCRHQAMQTKSCRRCTAID
jgi:hypothetical protein